MIDLNNILPIGKDLCRPECVLATSNGRLYTADWRGGVAIIEPDNSQWLLLPKENLELRPNGICLLEDGSFLIAHLGETDGGIYHLKADGTASPFCLEIDGTPLPPTNYPHLDFQGRLWITISTRQIPRAKGYNQKIADGFIVLIENNRARIVADNLGYTNECLVDPNGKFLYVNETFARRLVRFEISMNGNLSNKTTIAEFGHGTFPDGMTFDNQGGIWITSIISNRVIRILPNGDQETIIEDNEIEHLDKIETAFLNGEMGRPHLDRAYSQKLKNISSLAFGGSDLKSAYLGCLLDRSIYRFKAPYAGQPPAHWHFRGPEKNG